MSPNRVKSGDRHDGFSSGNKTILDGKDEPLTHPKRGRSKFNGGIDLLVGNRIGFPG
jgi:hypothetical protein